MKNISLILAILITFTFSINAQKIVKSSPIFKDGEAQIVPAFEDETKWLRHDLWVEAEFDTDGDGKLDRIYSFKGSALAEAEITNHRLIYVSPILSEDIHISGTPKITVKLASSKAAANLSVWLVSLPWTEGRNTKITDNIITRGWADPQNHKSIRESEPLVPGEFYEVTFDLMPDDQIIPKGQQIGLMIFSSDKEYTLWPSPGTELTVDLDGTSLPLPIVGGIEVFDKAVK